MDKHTLEEIAAQLAKPTGKFGKQVATSMNRYNREMNLNTIQALEIQSGDTVLEAGMANGCFVKQVLTSAKNVRYIGCDYSPDMVLAAIRQNQRFFDNNTAQFLDADFRALPLENHSVHKLFTVNTLYFWEDASDVLAEFKRVLVPEGILSIGFRPAENLKHYPFHQYLNTLYTPEMVEHMLTEHGFTPVKTIHKIESEIEIEGTRFYPEHVVMVAKARPPEGSN